MKRHLLTAVLTATLLPAVADAQPAPAPGDRPKSCFFASQINGFRADGDRVLNLRIGVRDIYRLDLLGACHDIRFAETIGVEGSSGSNQICSGLDATVITLNSPTGPRRCAVRSVTRLTPEEVAAMRKGTRP
jgi:hypothetical protein